MIGTASSRESALQYTVFSIIYDLVTITNDWGIEIWPIQLSIETALIDHCDHDDHFDQRATRAGFVFQSPHRTTQMASVWQIQTVHAFHSHLSLFSCVCICICTRTLYIKFHFAPFPLPIVVLKRILGGDVMFFTSTSSPLHWVELRKSWTVNTQTVLCHPMSLIKIF